MMGRDRLNGVLVIDKPGNITSAGVVGFVKQTLKAEKVGHAGTLDPFAEGVLICCINQATKLAGFLLHGKKKYTAVLKLGEETDTQDCTGTVISTGKLVDFSPQIIQNAFKRFKGPIEQLPPVYSALKHQGVPLYKLARRGKPVQKPARHVLIYDITIQDIALPLIHFEVVCSAGTYIRTLCADIGKSLGCGGHLTELKRTESSGFTLEQAISLSELKELTKGTGLSAKIISMTDALWDMPQFCADAKLAEKINHGQMISIGDLTDTFGAGSPPVAGADMKIVDRDGDLIAIMNHSGPEQRLDYCCVFPK